jgi:hypothetical protein
MDFMAMRAQFLNSISALLLVGCAGKKVSVPPVFIRMDDPALRAAGPDMLYKEQPLSGYLYALYPGGDTAALEPYANGRAEGWSCQWWPKRRLMEERFYAAGRKEGLHRGWWENGLPRYVYHFNDDEYEGALQEWAENGQRYRYFHYRKGHEEGLQQMWWPDGSLRANYVVKGGEQYGLIGRKLCTNEEKNITTR